MGDLLVHKEDAHCYPIYYIRGTNEFESLALIHFKGCCVLGATDSEEASVGVSEEFLDGYRMEPDEKTPIRKWVPLKLRRKQYGKRYPRS
jgi:hypothetical protein